MLKKGYDNKIDDVEGKIPNITGLGITAALTAVKNTILSIDDMHIIK